MRAPDSWSRWQIVVLVPQILWLLKFGSWFQSEIYHDHMDIHLFMCFSLSTFSDIKSLFVFNSDRQVRWQTLEAIGCWALLSSRSFTVRRRSGKFCRLTSTVKTLTSRYRKRPDGGVELLLARRRSEIWGVEDSSLLDEEILIFLLQASASFKKWRPPTKIPCHFVQSKQNSDFLLPFTSESCRFDLDSMQHDWLRWETMEFIRKCLRFLAMFFRSLESFGGWSWRSI